MNQTILKKVIDELKKDEPNTQYVLGILETLYEMNGPITPPVQDSTKGNPFMGKAMESVAGSSLDPEDAMLNAAVDEKLRLIDKSAITIA